MKLLIDTSAFKAFYDEDDEHHEEATSFLRRIKEETVPYKRFFTTDYVLDETLTLIRLAHSHAKSVEFGDALLNSKAILLIYINENVVKNAWNMFKEYTDKFWSFTDCVSFIIMKKLKITSAFAFDKNFVQAGFRIVP